MSKYKAYIFDFDLTLVNSVSPIVKCFKHALSTFGYAVPDDKTIIDTIGLPLTDAFDILTNLHPVPEKAQMRDAYVEFANGIMAKESLFYPDALGILQTLQTAERKVAIVSSKMRFRIIETFECQTSNIPVDLIIGLDDASTPKPDPEGLDMAVRKLGVDKSEVLYIGDSYIDAQTAQNAGVDFAGVSTGPTPKEKLLEYPHIYVGESLTDIFQNI
ncbi:MAG: HAD-IA family hydrolase [Ruminococcus sp.]|nr:HAD-IA family hydrolase [Ruminococcus sp.]